MLSCERASSILRRNFLEKSSEADCGRCRVVAVKWPRSIDLAACGVATPAVAIDPKRLGEVVLSDSDSYRSQGFGWRPLWRGSYGRAVWAAAGGGAGVALGLAFGSSAAAAEFADWGGDGLSLLPPATAAAAERLAAAARHGRVTVACDHFAHAELLSDACRGAGSEVELLVRVDAGRQRLGVRPGPDLAHFVRGVRLFPRVRVAGILLDRSVAVGHVPTLTAHETARFVARCRVRLAKEGGGSLVSVGRAEDLRVELAGEGPSEVRAPLPSGGDGRKPWAVVLATVIGRPTRDIAVLDVGRSTLGPADVVVVEVPGAAVSTVGDDVTVLILSGAGEELLIGDLVVMTTEWNSLRSDLQVVICNDGHWVTAERPR